MLCYVDHHDAAYAWAMRRKLETHPTTGAAQLVEIRETVKEVVVPVYVQTELVLTKKPVGGYKALFAGIGDIRQSGGKLSGQRDAVLSKRCFSRVHSRAFSVWRLSPLSLPLPSPISSLMRPLR